MRIWGGRRRLAALAMLATVWILAGGALRANAAEKTVLTIVGTGDSEDLLRTMAARFMRENPDITVQVPDSTGSTIGIKEVLAGKAVFARTARPLTDEEKNQGLEERVFATVPVVFAVNRSVTGVSTLTAEQILAIFSGPPQDWSQVGAPAGPIARICREMPGSSRLAVNTAIPDFANLTCEGQAVAYTTHDVVDMLAHNAGTIGYTSLSSITTAGVTPLAFEGVVPSAQTLANRTYPLFIPLALAYKAPLPPAAAHFLEVLASPDAATLLSRFGCLPQAAPTAPGAVVGAEPAAQ